MSVVANAETVERKKIWIIEEYVSKDVDGDGVPDNKDECHDSLIGEIVGRNGCGLPLERLENGEIVFNPQIKKVKKN